MAGQFGQAIPSGGDAIQAAISRRGGPFTQNTAPILNQSPNQTPGQQGVPQAPSGLPSAQGPTQPGAKPPDAETTLIIKALSQRLGMISKQEEGSVGA